MKLTLERKCLKILHLFVANPWELPLTAIEPPLKQWSAKDAIVARQILAFQKFLEQKVYIRADGGKFHLPEKWEGALPASLIERLLEIVRHYEPIGRLVSFSDDYYSLKDALEGKPAKNDLLDELLGYNEPEEKQKD